MFKPKKICPCCNAAATQQQLLPNKQFDRIISIITTEKDKASKDYFDTLINGGNPIQTNNNKMSVSPVEQALLGHVQKHIKYYHEYQRKLEENTVSKKQQIKEKYSALIKSQTKKDQKRRYKAEREEKYNELSIIHKQTTEIIEKTLEKYLKEFSVPALLFPVIVHISIPNKNELIKYVQLEPHTTIAALRQEVQRHMEGRGDSVVGFEKANIFALVHSEGDVGIPISDDHIPIVETYNPEPGAIFVLQGQLKCARDAPKKCYKAVHASLGEKVVPIDYFTCRTCTLNWLCTACVEGCHKGHDVTTFHMNHTPTWACCYCSKKKCNLIGNK